MLLEAPRLCYSRLSISKLIPLILLVALPQVAIAQDKNQPQINVELKFPVELTKAAQKLERSLEKLDGALADIGAKAEASYWAGMWAGGITVGMFLITAYLTIVRPRGG